MSEEKTGTQLVREMCQTFREVAETTQFDAVKEKLKKQHIETPSWGYGNSGTRFKTFAWPGAANTVREKLADAAYVHRLTGIAPSVALHIPWDKTDDWTALRQYAEEKGIAGYHSPGRSYRCAPQGRDAAKSRS
ncbi:MAG: hypothetical protein P8Y91_12475 [Desulfuromonadales bacterium]